MQEALTKWQTRRRSASTQDLSQVRRVAQGGIGGGDIPFSRASRHSKVISNSYLSENLAGLFTTLTPRSETTDMLLVLRGRGGGAGG